MYVGTDRAIDTEYIPPVVVESFTDLVKDAIVLAMFLESIQGSQMGIEHGLVVSCSEWDGYFHPRSPLVNSTFDLRKEPE
jgi:hypothetical protein